MAMANKPSPETETTLVMADGQPLKKALTRAMRRARLRAFLLVSPPSRLCPRNVRTAYRTNALFEYS